MIFCLEAEGWTRWPLLVYSGSKGFFNWLPLHYVTQPHWEGDSVQECPVSTGLKGAFGQDRIPYEV